MDPKLSIHKYEEALLTEKPWKQRNTRGGGRHRKFQTDTEMAEAIKAYIDDNATTQHTGTNKRGERYQTKDPMSWLGMLHAIGMSRRGIEPYQKGIYDEDGNEFVALLEYAREVVENDLEIGATKGIYNDRMVSANLSAHYGWRQVLHVEESVYISTEQATDTFISMMDELRQLLPYYTRQQIIDVDTDE